MPSQVTVVRRPRRSLFAFPRALPDWLRSFWAAIVRRPRRAEASDPMDLAPGGSAVRPRFPRLVRAADGAHRCTGCELCVPVCPSRCLAVETEGPADARRITRFELTTGACIGCWLCAEACPEDALAMLPAAGVALAPLGREPRRFDLLADGDGG